MMITSLLGLTIGTADENFEIIVIITRRSIRCDGDAFSSTTFSAVIIITHDLLFCWLPRDVGGAGCAELAVAVETKPLVGRAGSYVAGPIDR